MGAIHVGLDWNQTLDLDVEERDWLLDELSRLEREQRKAMAPSSP